MRNLSILIAALKIIEEQLKESMTVNDLAEACYSSSSGLQKLFRYAFGFSVNEYITKRRISCASQELLSNGKSIINIALDYQYSSPEAFSRAFKRVWGISPNEFRKTRRFSDLLPKLKLEIDNGGIIMQNRKPIDISELYDELKKISASYVLSIDIVHFEQINKNFGYAAGDFVISETFLRLENEISENMLLFRIGGDEFAIVTKYLSLDKAEEMAKKIISYNGKFVNYNTLKIPLSLRVGISRLADENLNYYKTLDIMYHAIEKARETDDNIAIIE